MYPASITPPQPQKKVEATHHSCASLLIVHTHLPSLPPAPASPEPPKPLRCLQFTHTDHVTPSSDAHHACSLLGCFSSPVSQPGNGDSLFSVKPLVTHRCLFHYSCFSSWSVTFPINSPQGRRPCVNHLHVGVGGRVPGGLPWTANS